jgi:hypothetical protein
MEKVQKNSVNSVESGSGIQNFQVGIATGYGLDDQGVGVRVPVGGKNFHFSMSSRQALGSTQPSIQWVPAAFPGGKEAGE